ncbi:MAG: hypothetical protein HYW49_06980 [Deltaproteobacteria bacterium]|nr:hypothetical protein [Deltaproteobacteria bacterium]
MKLQMKVRSRACAFVLPLAALCSVAAFAADAGKARVLASYGDGWLEELNGLPVLHMKGTDEEMGRQYGYLLGDKIQDTIDYLKEIASRTEPRARLVPNWAFQGLRRVVGWLFWQTFPKDFRRHLDGIRAGGRERQPEVKLNRYDLAFMNSLIDLVGIAHVAADSIGPNGGSEEERTMRARKFLRLMGLSAFEFNCDSFAAWGPRTEGGKTFQTRNIDVTTGQGLERYPLVLIAKPEGGVPFVSAAYVGMAGVFTGMNASGVGLGQIWAFSKKIGLNTPWQVKVREVFTKARSAREAVLLLSGTGRMAYGNNFVFADAGAGGDGSTSEGFAVESSAARFSVFDANDPREKEALWNGEPYGIPLAHAVFRGDVALDPKLRSEQNASNGPDGDPRTASAYRNRYKGQSDRILAYEAAGVKIGKEQAEAISRETAMRDASLQTAVYANTDRELWVSYAKIRPDGSIQQAYDGVYAHIPFSRYLPTLTLAESGAVAVRLWKVNPDGETLNLSVARVGQPLAAREIRVQGSGSSFGRGAGGMLAETSVSVDPGVALQAGDVLELRDASDVLIDRLTVESKR